MPITFLLVPDKLSAHYIRKQLSQEQNLLAIQVGTWPELLEIARTSYCLPDPNDNWRERIESAMREISKAFWSKSMVYDPETTVTMVTGALLELLWFRGAEQQLNIEKLSKRGKKQIADLRRLHKKAKNVYPKELSLIRSLLKTDRKQSIRSIAVHIIDGIPSLNPWQISLVEMLNRHAAEAGKPDVNLSSFSRLLAWPPPKKGKNGLCHLQRFLFSNTRQRQKNRSGLQWIAVRDYMQEIEIAAGMVQQLLDNPDIFPEDIALLLPDSQDYTQVAANIFTKAGIPLSGLETISSNRDMGRELVYNFLLCRQKNAPPPMLRASLFASPLLPWHETGVQVVQEFMDGASFKHILESIPEHQQNTAKLLHGRQADSPAKLKKSLRGLTVVLARRETLPEHCQTAMGIIPALFAILDTNPDEISWAELLQLCRPKIQTTSEGKGINQEGIRIFHPEKEPWQKVQHLLVLGFTDGKYPHPPKISPVIPEEDRILLEEQNIPLPTRKTLLQRQRNLFIRQLRAASKTITFFVPQLDSGGERISPSTSLGFMALLFEGISTGEELLLDPEKKKDRQQIKNLALVPRQAPVPPSMPVTRDLELGGNLLTKRKDENGRAKPESPSGMEKMMVSPLAWVLNRFSINSHEWSPETLDALVTGSIAHEIFEILFTRTKPLPQRGRIPALIETLFHSVIKISFPFLLADEWQVERRQMIREFSEAAQAWLDFLNINRLEILGEEVWLAGLFNQHPIRGKADLICRSPNGTLLVVDYKASKSKKRSKLMNNGYDHQASLYCRMLQTGEPPEQYPVKLKNQLGKSPQIYALYYTLRDQTILGESDTNFLENCEPAMQDIASNGLQLIKDRMKQLRAGLVELNTIDDEKWYLAETGITPYALNDSPLISLFMKEGEEK